MGPDLGGLFYALYVEIAWLHDKWREFSELFGTSAERVEVLNEAAPRFFGFLHDMMWEDILLHISRVSDRPEIGNRENLTILRLPDLIKDLSLRNEVQLLIDSATRNTLFARDWRNRQIAHRDLDLALGHDSKRLDDANRLTVREAIDAIDNVMYRLHSSYLGDGLSLEVLGGYGDAVDLLVLLEDGLRARRERDARLSGGTPYPEDLKSSSRI